MSIRNFFSSNKSKDNNNAKKNINDDDDNQSLATHHSFNHHHSSNNNEQRQQQTPITQQEDGFASMLATRSRTNSVGNNNNSNGGSALSGWVDVGKEIQIMAWPICCNYLNGDCEFMEKPSCCAYLHENPMGSSRPCQLGEKCERKHFKRNWEPDNSTDRCRNCLKEFGVVRRRSHCRECGRIICKDCCKNVTPIGKVCAVCEFKLKVAAQGKGSTVIPSMRNHNSAELLAKYTNYSPEKDEYNKDSAETNANNNQNNNSRSAKVYGRNSNDNDDDLSASDNDNDEQNSTFLENTTTTTSNNNNNTAANRKLLEVEESRPAIYTIPSNSTNNNNENDSKRIEENHQNNTHHHQAEEEEEFDSEITEDQDDFILQLKKSLAGEIAAHGYDDNTQDEFFDILFQLAERYEQLVLELKENLSSQNQQEDHDEEVYHDTRQTRRIRTDKMKLREQNLLNFYRQQRTEILSKLLSIRETVYGKEHRAAAQILTMIGEAKRNDGEFSESISTLGRALTICENEYGSDDPETANVLSHIGVTYHTQLVELQQQQQQGRRDQNDEDFIAKIEQKQNEYLRRSIEVYETCGEGEIADEMRHAWNIF